MKSNLVMSVSCLHNNNDDNDHDDDDDKEQRSQYFKLPYKS